MGLKTPLYELHKRLKAKFVLFAGWDMPISYTSILEEAVAVRTSTGIFDVSHMGRVFVRGTRAGEFLNYLTTNDVLKLQTGEVKYSLILNERGGTIDDVTLYKLGEAEFMLCVNASNREKVINHLKRFSETFGVEIEDKSSRLVQIALQGPRAVEILEKFYPSVGKLKFYTFKTFGDVIVSRTGYTGEDGFEIYIPPEGGVELFKKLLEFAKPCGLGARDVLRIEAGYPLYGHELSEELDPREANLSRFINVEKDFYGKEGLEKRGRPQRKLFGLKLEGRRIARQGINVFKGGKPIGEVTSGTYSPNLKASIALAFLDKEVQRGEEVEVLIGNKAIKAQVVSPRFIDNTPRKTKK